MAGQGVKFLYFPGCSLESSAGYYDSSIRAVCSRLGIILIELEDWNCCGATALASTDFFLSHFLPARNLALATGKGLELVVACNACLATLQRTNSLFEGEATPCRLRVQEALDQIGRELRGPVTVKHIIEVLVNDVGLSAIRKRVVRILTGIRAVPYYGCQIARPRYRSREAELPGYLDEMLKAIGISVAGYEHKTRCCGGALMTSKQEVAMGMCEELLREAAEQGADVIVVTCPMCQLNLDLYQHDVNRHFGTSYRIPVLYFSQLLGLALGVRSRELGLGREMVSAHPLLRKHALA